MTDVEALVDRLRAGDDRALGRAISIVEDRSPGHRRLVAALYRRPAEATVLGVTGSPGVGKSTLVDGLARAYRERGERVGVVAVDPSSPFSGGALLGDRVRMAGSADDGVFVRSMSARGVQGGLAAATLDAVRAIAAAGHDVVIVETVGTGQTEVDVVGTADTVVVTTQPGSGDDVQALKAGLLEIGDVYVVNKADRRGADRTVHDLREMVAAADGLGSHRVGDRPAGPTWEPPVVETVATEGRGVAAVIAAVDDHLDFLAEAGLADESDRRRCAEAIRTHVAADVEALVERTIEDGGGMDALVEAVRAGEADPYGIAASLLETMRDGADATDPPAPTDADP